MTRGGKREGAGRPPATRPVGRPPIDNPATKRVAVKVTPEQHDTWIALGASKWLKAILDEMKNKSKKSTRRPNSGL